MKIIYLLFVNTFAGNRDQCHPIWLSIKARPLSLQIYPFNDFFFSLTLEREQTT